MALSIAASHRALTDPAPLDLTDASLVPDVEISAPIGVNLTLLGASETDVPGEDTAEHFLSKVNLPLLTSSVAASYKGGVDLITLDRDFHVHPAAPIASSALDGVTVAARLNQEHAPRMCIEVPSDPAYIRDAISLLTRERVRHAALMITLQELDDYSEFAKVGAEARSAGLELWLVATNPVFTGEHADIAVSMFDTVRVRSIDRRAVRAMRFALHKAAQKAGRTMRVFADIGMVISATLQAAEERALLISELNGSPIFEGMESVVGTVYDVADAIEAWIGMGVADGLILTPASLPTDLASVLKGVLPLLDARAKIEAE